MNILPISSFVAAAAGAVLLFIPKAKTYGSLLIATAFILFGLNDLTTGHDKLYGAGMLVIGAVLATRFAVDQAKRK